jgi:2-aminoadipate transaminase
VLQYGTNQGRPGLRRLLADRLAALEPELDPEKLAAGMLVTNGSQQALYLAAQVLCDPGDIVLVDRPSYFVFLEMLAGLGVEAVSIPTDAKGKVDTAALSQLLDTLKRTGRAERLRAVYLVSYFSNPSARSLDEDEKTAVAEALSSRDLIVPVLEDAAYRELYYVAPHPARSVLTLPAWRAFPKFYLSTLTKSFATGLKVGYGICTDEAWLKKMLHVKGHHDFGTANFNQALFERALAAGGLDRQLGTIRPWYRQKMLALHETLLGAGLLQHGWHWEKPSGGLYLWLRGPEELDTGLDGEFCRKCIAKGVVFVPGALCFGDNPPMHQVRLSFGVLRPAELQEAGRRFAAVATG